MVTLLTTDDLNDYFDLVIKKIHEEYWLLVGSKRITLGDDKRQYGSFVVKNLNIAFSRSYEELKIFVDLNLLKMKEDNNEFH